MDITKLDQLAELSFITSVEYDADTQIVLAQSTTQIGASRVWLEFGVEGQGIKIAILDTGIDNEHPDVQNVIAEQDFTGEGTDDEHGHGTHVASTAAGTGASSAGVNKGVNAQGAGRVDAYAAFINATGVEPKKEEPSQEPSEPDESPEQERKKERAVEKSKEKGYVKEVTAVKEREKAGTPYLVVEGKKDDTYVRVWVNENTEEIETIEEMGWLRRIWVQVAEWVTMTFKKFFF